VSGSEYTPFGFRRPYLPHFTKDDFSPEACGFVENSYLRGLTPQEFFIPPSRRQIVSSRHWGTSWFTTDGTVRNSHGDLIQFVYGDEDMDRAFIECQKIETFGLDNEAFQHNYRVDVTTAITSCPIPCRSARMIALWSCR